MINSNGVGSCYPSRRMQVRPESARWAGTGRGLRRHPCASGVRVVAFEHQAIIGFLTGPASHDNPVKVSCISLYVKWLNRSRTGERCPGTLVKSQDVVDGT